MNYFRPAIYHYQAQVDPSFWRRKLEWMWGQNISKMCVHWSDNDQKSLLTSYSQWDRGKEHIMSHLCAILKRYKKLHL